MPGRSSRQAAEVPIALAPVDGCPSLRSHRHELPESQKSARLLAATSTSGNNGLPIASACRLRSNPAVRPAMQSDQSIPPYHPPPQRCAGPFPLLPPHWGLLRCGARV
jgi:hypothetical protein